MKWIGSHFSREIYWFNYDDFQLKKLPKKNWLCLAISDVSIEKIRFEQFARHAIKNGILEFKGQGKFGERLHTLFDETITKMEVTEKHPPISVMTTGQENETLADAFWQCFYATCLPESADYGNISVICLDIGGTDKSEELQKFIARFEAGWIPE